MESSRSSSAWTFTERVAEFLARTNELWSLGLARSGMNLEAEFHWQRGAAVRARLAELDVDDFRSYILTWRLFVMRDEPVHLPTVLRLSETHLTHESLRHSARAILERVEAINRNDPDRGYRMAFTLGNHEYSPWEVADLWMHGALFHSKDRRKAGILRTLEPEHRAMVEQMFREYVAKIAETIEYTALVLQKAVDRGYLSDEPIAP